MTTIYTSMGNLQVDLSSMDALAAVESRQPVRGSWFTIGGGKRVDATVIVPLAAVCAIVETERQF